MFHTATWIPLLIEELFFFSIRSAGLGSLILTLAIYLPMTLIDSALFICLKLTVWNYARAKALFCINRLTVFQDNVVHEAKECVCWTRKQIIHTWSQVGAWPQMSGTNLCVRFVMRGLFLCIWFHLTTSFFAHRHLGTQRLHIITTPVVLASSFRWTIRRAALWEGKDAETDTDSFSKKSHFS